MLKFATILAITAAVSSAAVSSAGADAGTTADATSACASYSGTGNTTLGPFTVAADTVVYWSNDGTSFRLVNVDQSSPNLDLDTTTAGYGAIIVPAGTYTEQVFSDGAWSLAFQGASCSTAPAGASPNVTSASSATASNPASFGGSGNSTVGPVVLYWRTDGSSFQMQNHDRSNPNGEVGLTAAGSGATILPAGTYTLDVSTDGNWSVTVDAYAGS